MKLISCIIVLSLLSLNFTFRVQGQAVQRTFSATKTGKQVSEIRKADSVFLLHGSLSGSGQWPSLEHLQQSEVSGLQKLDSVIWETWYNDLNKFVQTSRDVYTYDTYGNAVSELYCSRDESIMNWNSCSKRVNEFDADNKVLLSVGYVYIPGKNRWNPESRYESRYDINGNQILAINYHWNDTTDIWTGDTKSEIEYDLAGNVTLSADYVWNYRKAIWTGNRKDLMTYNSNKQLTSVINFEWDIKSGNWFAVNKSVYEYDVHGFITHSLYYTLDKISNNWNIAGQYKTNHFFNGSGKDTLIITDIWDPISDIWNNAYKSEYVYNSENESTRQTDYIWNKSMTAWIFTKVTQNAYSSSGTIASSFDVRYNSFWSDTVTHPVQLYKGETYYDSNGNDSLSVNYQWNLLLNRWIPELKGEMSFDSEGRWTSGAEYEWNDTLNEWIGENKSTQEYDNKGNVVHYSWYGWDLSATDWMLYGYSSSFYSDHEFEPKTGYINVYPNPASDYVVFDVSKMSVNTTVSIFNRQGKLVLQQPVSLKKQIFIGHLAKGLYLFTLTNNGQVYKGKFVKI